MAMGWLSAFLCYSLEFDPERGWECQVWLYSTALKIHKQTPFIEKNKHIQFIHVEPVYISELSTFSDFLYLQCIFLAVIKI